MNVQQRIDAAIADFNDRHPEWDTTITDYVVELSNRGRGLGLSIYVHTRDGVGFEVPIEAGDDLLSIVGGRLH